MQEKMKKIHMRIVSALIDIVSISPTVSVRRSSPTCPSTVIPLNTMNGCINGTTPFPTVVPNTTKPSVASSSPKSASNYKNSGDIPAAAAPFFVYFKWIVSTALLSHHLSPDVEDVVAAEDVDVVINQHFA